MAKEKITKGSVTKTIKRSQIKLNPYNPKNHTDEEIKRQAANIRRVGALGGIQWNERSGNLVDGHRRILAQDLIHKYDGTPETDYDVKVEAVDFDQKTELEQLTYEATQNTKADYNLIAKYLDDIDPKEVGFTDDEIKQLEALQDSLDEINDASMEDLGDDLLAADPETPQEETPQAVPQPTYELPTVEKSNDEIVKEHEEKPKMTKEEVKAEKQHCQDVADNRWENVDKYILLTFDTTEGKEALCDLLGITPTNDMQIKGEDVLKLVE